MNNNIKKIKIRCSLTQTNKLEFRQKMKVYKPIPSRNLKNYQKIRQ